MSEQPTNSSRSAQSLGLAGGALPQLAPRDYLYAIELDFDIDAQLLAIRGVLDRNRKGAVELSEEIARIEEHTRRLEGVPADWAIQECVDRNLHSAYQDAAHSMSALGMLAPLVETIFYQCLRGIGNRFYPASQPAQGHSRSKAAYAIQWDCHLFIVGNRSETNLVRGILQVCAAIGLTDKLPAHLEPTLSALFAYRNCMFHNGFEWPTEVRDRFAKRISDEGWPKDWFSVATSDSEPWIFYLSDTFIEHCLTTIGQVLDGIGLFVRDKSTLA